MSTRCTIREARDESTGQGFHLYDDLLEERDCVMLEFDGMTFDASVSFTSSGRPDIRVRVRIRKHLTRELGADPKCGCMKSIMTRKLQTESRAVMGRMVRRFE